MEQVRAFTFHKPSCARYWCGTCGCSQSAGHHEDSYNGDTSWHAFIVQACDCGLDSILTLSHQEQQTLLDIIDEGQKITVSSGEKVSPASVLLRHLRDAERAQQTLREALEKIHAIAQAECDKEGIEPDAFNDALIAIAALSTATRAQQEQKEKDNA
jgi:hypothetical protein